MTLTEPPRKSPAAPQCRGPGTPIRRFWPWRWSGSSAAHGSTPGHLGELQGPGSYFASATGPVPIVITLDGDGTCGASSTSAAIAARSWRRTPGSGARSSARTTPGPTASTAACGPLRAEDEDPAFDAGCMGLVPVSVDTWGPFVFANPDPEAEPLSDALGDLPEVVAEHGLDVDSLRFNRRVALRDQGQLEDRHRELPRVLPLSRQPSRLGRGHRRAPAGAAGRRPADQPVRAGAPALARRSAGRSTCTASWAGPSSICGSRT